MPKREQGPPLTETDYDAVIIGTDLPQAVLAAALSIAGSRVLHLDSNSFYGGNWSTIQLRDLDPILKTSTKPDVIDPPASHSNIQSIAKQFPNHNLIPLLSLSLREQLFPLGARLLIHESSHDIEPSVQSCYVDLVPRPLMSSGKMIDLLAATHVGQYLDFRGIEALYVHFTGSAGLQRVPGSRADVFRNKFISMTEKRLLMRYVTKCYETVSELKEAALEDGKEFVMESIKQNGPLREEMDTMQLTPKLRTFLTHSVLFSIGVENASMQQGMEAAYNYQASLARFGTKTPFLYANYGSGELAQAFCRLCAVHGGTYVLRRGAVALLRAKTHEERSTCQFDSKTRVITDAGDVVTAKSVFTARNWASNACDADSIIWRVAVVVNGSIVNSNEPERIMITVPRGNLGNERSAVRIRQMDKSVMVCPEGLYVMYGETIEKGGREEDVLAAIEEYVDLNRDATNGEKEESVGTQLVNDLTDAKAHKRPKVIWGVSYGRPCEAGYTNSEGVVQVSASEREHDANEVLKEAERCFAILHPDISFFPVPKERVAATL